MEDKEFNSLHTIEKAVNTSLKAGRFGFIFGVISLFVSGLIVIFIYNESLNNQFAIDLKTGKAFFLTQTQQADNQKAEIRHHIGEFYNNFLNLEPNRESIEVNINNALFLGDDCIKDLYELYREQGFYNGLVQRNIYTRGHIDSIYDININSEPFTAKIIGKQILLRGKNKIEKHYNAVCKLRKVSQRTDKNSHGLFFTEFTVINNKPVSKD